MNLIDCSYFYSGPLQVMNARPVDDLDTNADAVQECLTAYIERYQADFLRRMVGASLAADVEAYLGHLQENADHEDDGQWEPYVDAGMEELCSRLRLPFAHYVYFKLAGDANQILTVTGLQLMKSANTPQPPRQRMVKVWNDMVELDRRFIEWAETSSYDVLYRVEMITNINQFNL